MIGKIVGEPINIRKRIHERIMKETNERMSTGKARKQQKEEIYGKKHKMNGMVCKMI